MILEVEKSTLTGAVPMPGSKSHTVRAIILGSLAEGESLIRKPLESLDTLAAVDACRALGAEIAISDPDCWRIVGVGGRPRVPESIIDVANSGTTFYIMLATAALCRDGWVVLNGDEQIRRRPAGELMQALQSLGVEIFSTRENGQCPIVVRGPLKGGKASLEALSSQWVTAILLNAPLGEGETELEVKKLYEAPYVRMTLDWIEKLGIQVEYAEDFSYFRIPGGQRYKAFDLPVAADFSSATFFLVAGAALDAEIELTGLDMSDSQGDKAVVDYLRKMGAQIEHDPQTGNLRLSHAKLHGTELDMNATPDALPAMAVAAALASGTTHLTNVPQARLKETDRIAVMAQELSRMGVEIEERPDGLVIQGTDGGLRGALLHGHGDHRVVMALSLAAMAASGASRIDTAEAISVTFPDYVHLMQTLGARMRMTR
ncbi:MAG TPA: 3-phosphoshikimate 1-carboxyvinyltransferase [Candidatus Sumerlaeota bacterium]|nr:3-phosphoshikimate 1-carboxyvinyltransferase [Candidatus Sumerlaeota bacterium]